MCTRVFAYLYECRRSACGRVLEDAAEMQMLQVLSTSENIEFVNVRDVTVKNITKMCATYTLCTFF